jgi:hypothetical protein
MPGEFDSQHWRDSAAKARTKADQMRDPRAKRRLLGLADFYEGLAKRHVERDWKHRQMRHEAKSKMTRVASVGGSGSPTG